MTLMTENTDQNQNLSLDDIKQFKDKDPWLYNKLLNIWEQKNLATRLESYPRDLSLPFSDSCNARCIFCSYWGSKPRFMSEEELVYYREILKHLEFVGINPAGEPLLHPGFDAIITKIREMIDPRCSFYLVTNGIMLHLKERVILDNIDSLTISLNASSQNTHEVVMGVRNQFKQVVRNIENISNNRERSRRKLDIYVTYVVLRQNLHEIPNVIRLCEEIGVDRIYFRNLATANSNNPIKPTYNPHYLELQPHLHENFRSLAQRAIYAIDSSKIEIVAEPNKWEEDISDDFWLSRIDHRASPPFRVTMQKGNSIPGDQLEEWITISEEEFPLTCQYLYKYMIDPRLSNIQPVCVYMETLPGYEPIAFNCHNFLEEVRNAPAMIALRKALKSGPRIPTVCTKCNILSAFKYS